MAVVTKLISGLGAAAALAGGQWIEVEQSGVSKRVALSTHATFVFASFGGQLAFPATANPSANANTLDDYEEGTFTPTVVSSGGGTPTYTAQVGFYTKVGNRVLYDLRIVLATLGTLAAGNVTIAGLPFTAENTANRTTAQPFNCNNMDATAVAAPNANIVHNQAVVTVSVYSAGVNGSMTVAMLTGTSVLNIAGQYTTD